MQRGPLVALTSQASQLCSDVESTELIHVSIYHIDSVTMSAFTTVELYFLAY